MEEAPAAFEHPAPPRAVGDDHQARAHPQQSFGRCADVRLAGVLFGEVARDDADVGERNERIEFRAIPPGPAIKRDLNSGAARDADRLEARLPVPAIEVQESCGRDRIGGQLARRDVGRRPGRIHDRARAASLIDQDARGRRGVPWPGRQVFDVDTFALEAVTDQSASPVVAERVDHCRPCAEPGQGHQGRGDRPAALGGHVKRPLDVVVGREMLDPRHDIDGRDPQADDIERMRVHRLR